MDVLRPPIIKIGNRLYRKNFYFKESQSYNPEDDEIVEDQNIGCENEDELCDSLLDIVTTKRGLSLTMVVPNFFYKFIIGKQGETKKRLESETHTKIVIPKHGERDETVVINGMDRKCIVSAKTRIDVIVNSARQKHPFTHFLSIPVCTEAICKNFEDFKIQVLEKYSGERGFDASLFQNPKRLHLTLGTLVLLNNEDKKRATDLLKEFEKEFIIPTFKGNKLHVQICGLEYMNDDPAEVDVLYAKVQSGESSRSLQTMVDYLTEKFLNSGLMKKEHDKVKLHVTVINTLMRRDPLGIGDVQKAESKARESFDASRILKAFQDFDFGPLTIESIHLSQRNSSSETGYYESASYIKAF